jgi:hypothetical protein
MVTDENSHQHRYRPASRHLTHSFGLDAAAQHTHEVWPSLHPESRLLCCCDRYLQNADAVPLLRGERLYGSRLMVLYVLLNLHQDCLISAHANNKQQTFGKSSR